MSDVATVPNVVEINFSSRDEGVEDRVGDKKIIWKDILSEGKIEIAPIPGNDKKLPFTVLASGTSEPDKLKISLTDLVESYRDSAFKYVSIPDGHPKKGDSAFNNTGFVEGLRIVKKRGKHLLQAALGFTEPDKADKVKRGTVPDVSSGIFLNYTRKSDAKQFPVSLNHVALTKFPIDQNLDRFKPIYASDDEIGLSEDGFDDFTIAVAFFADEEESDTTTAEVVWNEKDGTNWLREALTAALTPDPPSAIEDGRPYVPRPSYYVNDLSQSKGVALVEEYFKGDRTRYVIPFKVDGDNVSPAPAIRWTEGRDALVAAGEDFGDVSIGKINQGIKLALEEMFGGEEGKKYKISETSYDKQVLINDPDNNVFLADFEIASGGLVLLAPVDEWEKKADAPKQNKTPKKVVPLYDLNTPEGRVAAHRRQMRDSLTRQAR